MYITNIWGIFFSICVPIIITSLLTYYEGMEDGKNIEKNKRRRVKYYG